MAFGAADNHLHAELATDRASAGAFALYVESGLRWQLGIGVRFERARIRPLHDQRHAYNTFHYLHRQDTRHDLPPDHDCTREGTSLPDLLGLRVLETSLIGRVRTCLPRVRREELVRCFPSRLSEQEQQEQQQEQAAAIDLDVLADAAAAALALPDLRGRAADASRARRAAVLAVGPDVSSQRLGDCLGIGARAVQILRTLHVETRKNDDALVRAVEKQAALRTAAKKFK